MPAAPYQAPDLSADEATPRRVRDELANCVANAFSRARRIPNASPNPIQLRNDADRFIRHALEAAGHDYDEPSQEALRSVLDQWRKDGGHVVDDANVIQHHWNEMNKLVSQIGGS